MRHVGLVAFVAVVMLAVAHMGPAFADPSDCPSLPDVTQSDTTGAAVVSVDYTLPDLTSCGVESIQCEPQSGQKVFYVGTRSEVKCEAVFSDSSTYTMSFFVEVLDATPPAITGLPGDLYLEATMPGGAEYEFDIGAADAVTKIIETICTTSWGVQLGRGIQVLPLGDNTVTCTASDEAGNTASASFNVQVIDTSSPTIDLPGDITAEATDPSGAVVSFNVTASDLVSGPVAVTCDSASGSVFKLGTTPVTCYAVDDAGWTESGTFQVTVVDTTPPTVTPHADITAEATDASGAAVSFDVTASDLVSGPVAVTCEPSSGSLFPLGTTTVACVATDDAGRAAYATFKVIVVRCSFTGFLAPVKNAAENVITASQTLAVKWSLGGNYGVAGLIAEGFPRIVAVPCVGSRGTVEPNVKALSSAGLKYDAKADQYMLNTKFKGLVQPLKCYRFELKLKTCDAIRYFALRVKK